MWCSGWEIYAFVQDGGHSPRCGAQTLGDGEWWAPDDHQHIILYSRCIQKTYYPCPVNFSSAHSPEGVDNERFNRALIDHRRAQTRSLQKAFHTHTRGLRSGFAFGRDVFEGPKALEADIPQLCARCQHSIWNIRTHSANSYNGSLLLNWFQVQRMRKAACFALFLKRAMLITIYQLYFCCYSQRQLRGKKKGMQRNIYLCAAGVSAWNSERRERSTSKNAERSRNHVENQWLLATAKVERGRLTNVSALDFGAHNDLSHHT